MLRSLQFTQSQAAVGQSLVLLAEPLAAGECSPQPVRLSVTSGAQDTAWLRSPFDSLSDAEFTALIADLDGRVLIGFKEADAAQGVDETGHSITSVETVKRMKDWVRQQGMTIFFEYTLTPTIAATMAADVELVARVRGHENVDYLEPDMVGEYTAAPGPERSARLVTVIPTSAGGDGSLRVQPGDRVTAEYHQPDGSVLRAVVSIRG
jgi:hypothetical protein